MVWICQIRLSLSEVVEVEKELKGHVRAENQKARIPDNRESKHQTELLTIENPKSETTGHVLVRRRSTIWRRLEQVFIYSTPGRRVMSVNVILGKG
jgi:hypothetical protein